MRVPDVLLSGNHAAIARWRLEQRIERTKLRRPDLWQVYQDARNGTQQHDKRGEQEDQSSHT
jgi:tRNA (guanine37-N1)-methyltransferase